ADLARLLLARGATAEAMREYRQHLDVSPYRGRQDASAHVSVALELTRRGQTAAAVEIFERLLELSRGDDRFERCAAFASVGLDPYRAFPLFVRAVERLRPYCTLTVERDRAVELLHAGQADAAIAALNAQLKLNPLLEDTYVILAEVYRSQGHAADAWGVVKRSLDLEDEHDERCRKFRQLSVPLYEAYAADIVSGLRRECEP